MCVCVFRGDNADDVMMPPLQEQCCRQGDECLLQKALDESRRESQSGTQEVSLKTYVCVCVCAVQYMCGCMRATRVCVCMERWAGAFVGGCWQTFRK